MPFTRRNLLLAPLGALAAATTDPEVHPTHPRIFFRREGWGAHNLTLDEVRKRGVKFADSLRVEHKPDPEAAPDWAMLHVITGEDEAARTALRHMKQGVGLDHSWTTTEGDQLEAIATAYDWLRGTWTNFGAADRREIEEILDISIADLNPDNHDEEMWTFPEWPEPRKVSFYRIGPHKLWGASYRILQPLLSRLASGEWQIEPPRPSCPRPHRRG